MINAKVGVGSSQINSDYSEEYSMIYKIAKSSLLAVDSNNPLQLFDKGIVENGVNIEQAIVKLAESYAFDKNAVDVFATKNPEIVVKYFKDWTEKQFETTVSENELRKILLADGSVERVIQTLVANLTESEGFEDYVNTKQVLEFGSTENDGETPFVKIGEDISIENTDEILTAIKDTVSGYKFVSDKFNKGGIKRATPTDRIVIVMPYDIKNKIDIESLAGVFNLDKAEIKNKIVEIDSGDCIYILDRDCIQKYTRLYRMTEQWNAKSLKMNYFLTVERMYAISQLFNGSFIKVIR